MASDYIILDVHAHVQTQALNQLNVSVIVEAFDKKYRQTLPAGQTLDDIFGDASQYDSLRAVRKQVIYRRQFLRFCFRSSNGCVLFVCVVTVLCLFILRNLWSFSRQRVLILCHKCWSMEHKLTWKRCGQ